ncbi:extracellular serine-rich protein [Colletotrichum tofieldiae]|uniref:Extracellular serine-rich protein n=1 Tax=Colletotrichum tofieldiae TaxID=708197 RepID=A0A166TSN8_9PEZI|nr:extracellular serine-rich protein [Colletotrichum tofieldiae]GKT56744.1 extracellular serine-rich protein [Colletotrichum tofieldiae]GKT76291.1 extracellular serine-rich protein [Colletotrichum tofieldiae]GKT87342.1 extracellular serine-rich protein [Colletotrichum tofieldiae]
MHISAMVVSALAAVAQAVDVQVVSVASTNNTLKFFPDKISAPVGSMVQFQFRGGNHSVVQSTFDNPCIPISNVNASAKGVYSGYQPVAASAAMGQIPVFTVMVSSTAPMWLYCSQAKHCQNGMVMVINENSKANATRTIENYARAAKNVAQAQIPGGGASGGSGGGSASPTGGAGGGSGGGSNGGGSGNGGGAGGASPSSPPTAGAVSITVPGTLLLALGAGFLLL